MKLRGIWLAGFGVVVVGMLAGLLYTTRSDRSHAASLAPQGYTDVPAALPARTSPPTAPRLQQPDSPVPHPLAAADLRRPAGLDAPPTAPAIRVHRMDRENFEAIEATPAEIEAYLRRRAELEAAADREPTPAPDGAQASMDDYVRRYNQVAVDVFGPERARAFFMPALTIDTAPMN